MPKPVLRAKVSTVHKQKLDYWLQVRRHEWVNEGVKDLRKWVRWGGSWATPPHVEVWIMCGPISVGYFTLLEEHLQALVVATGWRVVDMSVKGVAV